MSKPHSTIQSQSSLANSDDTPRNARLTWRWTGPDIDTIYQWTTLLIIPFYAINTSIRSQIVLVYAILFVLKVRANGYRKSGLEWVTLAAVLGLLASYAGVWTSEILKNSLRVGRIIVLPLLMAQYRPISRLENFLAGLFCGLGIYGIVRILYSPLVTGYALDRPYCFSDFFMHSSVIAVSGYFFFLIILLHKRDLVWKLLATLGCVLFLYLIVRHHVRASYLTVLVLTPLLLMVEVRRMHARSRGVSCLMLLGVITLLAVLRPTIVHTAIERGRAIVDLEDGSNRGRLVIWRRALETIRDNPLNGIGYHRFNRSVVDLRNAEFEWSFAHAHNELLGIMAETGLIGTIAWLAFKFKLLLLFYRHRRHWAGAYMMYLFLAFEIHNMFEYYLYERIAYIYVYLLFGLGLNQVGASQASTDSHQLEAAS